MSVGRGCERNGDARQVRCQIFKRSGDVVSGGERSRGDRPGSRSAGARARRRPKRVPSISSILLAMASRIASLCAFAADAPGPMGTTPVPEPGFDALGSESGTAAGLGFAGMGCSRSNGSAASSSPMARGGRSRRRPRRRRVCVLCAPNARAIAESEKSDTRLIIFSWLWARFFPKTPIFFPSSSASISRIRVSSLQKEPKTTKYRALTKYQCQFLPKSRRFRRGAALYPETSSPVRGFARNSGDCHASNFFHPSGGFRNETSDETRLDRI